MTTIRCAENCLYQKEGNCTYENTAQNQLTGNHSCFYFALPADGTKPASADQDKQQ